MKEGRGEKPDTPKPDEIKLNLTPEQIAVRETVEANIIELTNLQIKFRENPTDYSRDKLLNFSVNSICNLLKYFISQIQ